MIIVNANQIFLSQNTLTIEVFVGFIAITHKICRISEGCSVGTIVTFRYGIGTIKIMQLILWIYNHDKLLYHDASIVVYNSKIIIAHH